jgi:phage-related protein
MALTRVFSSEDHQKTELDDISRLIYFDTMTEEEKPVAWLHGEIKTPPFSSEARIEAGTLLGRLQQGENLGLPHSRPMTSIGPRCHELRIKDEQMEWRIVYRIDPDAILVVEVFGKKTRATPQAVIKTCRRRLRQYDAIAGD